MEFLWDLFHRIYDVEFLVRTGDLLVLGWGSSYGAIRQAVEVRLEGRRE